MTAYRDPLVLRRLYVDEGLSQAEVADRLDCCGKTVSRWLQKYGIETRAAAPRDCSGRDNSRWVERASFVTDPDGYERAECATNGEMVRIHRLAAVAWFGYDAVVGNDVHHEKPIPWLNTEENVEPLSPSDHRRLHARRQAADPESAFGGHHGAEAHGDD